MSTQELAPQKRTRYADEESVVLARNYKFSDEETDNRFISPDRDPESLCPYCDRLLPEVPTAALADLLEEAYRRSYRDARPANPLGRKAPVGVYASLCTRHMFESELMPKATAEGWPTAIDWSALSARVVALKNHLEGILHDAGRPIVYNQEKPMDTVPGAGPRMECIFWRELVGALELHGSRRAIGVEGLFGTFDKVQPGYYGEKGFVIMHETLDAMFPMETTSTDTIEPLELREFIGRVLIPEVAMCLIMEDMGINVGEEQRAVTIMRESSGYGVSMFPTEDENDFQGDGILFEE
ncbi:RTC4-like domain-containing protein [Mycena alexandri]|uniref:Restriction of telomere capping protein 4 n=1 Tax=Mycena alexandri TaxID=1745969 RepID=A0AAD6RWE8_9AGAR|nr:RTC4-like domain-containing protein [Mycena alexandri]